MSDQPTEITTIDVQPTPEQLKQPKAATKPEPITLISPDVWTLGHYQEYQTARLDYLDSLSDANRKTAATEVVDYFGGKALIDKGYVHISGNSDLVAKFKEYLKKIDISLIPSSVVAEVIWQVSKRVEASINLRFLG